MDFLFVYLYVGCVFALVEIITTAVRLLTSFVCSIAGWNTPCTCLPVWKRVLVHIGLWIAIVFLWPIAILLLIVSLIAPKFTGRLEKRLLKWCNS